MNGNRRWYGLFGVGMFLLAAIAVWATWTVALGADAAPAAGATNSVVKSLLPSEEAATDFVKRNSSALSFGLDRVEILKPDLLGRPRWQYLASLLYVVLAFVVSRMVDGFIGGRLRELTRKTATRWDDIIVGLADGPVKVVTFVVLVHVGLQLFEWPGWIETALSLITILAVALTIAYVALKGVDAVVGVWRGRLSNDRDKSFNEQFLILNGKLLKAGICVIVLLTVLPKFGVDITALLGSVSVLGLALGLAAQDTVANLFGAVAVFLDKPFRIGDRIQVAGIDGTVEEMGLRATTVRSLDGYLITIPNKTVGNNTVINISRRPTIKTELNFGVTYETPVEKVKQATAILEQTFREHPKTHDVIVTFNKFLDSSLNINVVHWWKDADARAQLAGLQELNLKVKERFDAEGIEFAYPTQTVHNKIAPGTLPGSLKLTP